MQTGYLWLVALQTGQPAGIGAYMAHAVVGFFAMILFSVSLYAWSRRRNVGLLLVSSAFVLFCLKEVLWFLAQTYAFDSSIDVTRTLLDLAVLGLFFAAITIRPRQQLE